MVPRRVTAALVALLLVTTAGCGALGGDGGGDGEQSEYANRLQNESASAMLAVETYDIGMEMEMAGEDQSVAVSMNGTYNQTARLAVAQMRTQGVVVDMYIDDTTVFVKPERADEWDARDMSGQDPWNGSGQLAAQRDVLQSGSVTFVENTTLDGEPVAVVRAQPSAEQFKELMQQQASGDVSSVSVSDITFEQYIHRETYRPRKVVMNATMSQQGQSYDVHIVYTFDDFDESTDITVPDAARNATAARAPLAPPA